MSGAIVPIRENIEAKKIASGVMCFHHESMFTAEEVIKNPQLINENPYGRCWMAVLKLSNIEELDTLL